MLKIAQCFALFFLLSNLTTAQTKTAEISLAKDEYLLDQLQVKDGFVLKVGGYYGSVDRIDWRLYFYSDALESEWVVPIPKIRNERKAGNFLVADPAGKFVYHLEPVYEYANVPVEFQVLQVRRNGELFVKRVPIEVETNAIMDFVFADSSALYLLEQGTPKTSHQRILHHYASTGLSYSKVVIRLPDLTGEKDAVAWRFAGHRGGRFFFYSSIWEKKQARYQVRLAEVDLTGTIVRTSNFRLPLNREYDYLEVGTAWLPPSSTCNAMLRERNYSHTQITRKGGSAISPEERYPLEERVLVVLNLELNQLVMTGLATMEGGDVPVLFARGYDLDSAELIWKFQHLLWKQTIESRDLAKAAPYPNNLNLRFLEGGELFIFVFNKKVVLGCEIDAYGELIAENMIAKPGASSSNRMEPEDAYCFRPGLSLNYADFIKRIYIDPEESQQHPILFEFEQRAALVHPQYQSGQIQIYLLERD